MKKKRVLLILIVLLLGLSPCWAQVKGLRTLTENELRMHLEFIAAEEFQGRETPSPHLEICTLYLANLAKAYGLKPIMPEDSYYQTIPVNVSSVSQANTRMRMISDKGERIYYYERDFGGSFSRFGSYSGDVVFIGFGLSAPDQGWDDCKDLDLSSKVVVILDGQLPESHKLAATANRLRSRINSLRDKGAAAVLSVVNKDRQKKKEDGIEIFYNIPRGRMAVYYESQRTSRSSPPSLPARKPPVPQRPSLPFASSEICHETALEILDLSQEELSDMFAKIQRGQQVPGKSFTEKRIELRIEVETRPNSTRNVLGLVEGSDPKLKNEYIVICAHHDHLGVRNGEVIAGADDNGSGTVALIEIAQALLIDRPKRSVIIAWFTGEERGYMGSQYFLNNCPVPVEKISACLNMDMLSRNDPESLYLVASNLLSSELDAAIHEVNEKNHIDFDFSYIYSNRTHPQRVYYRSDQYPHIRFGIPSVWFFCGFTPDYHTPRDVLEFVDYKKMLKATKLVYLTAYEIGNKKELLKLDVNPDVTKRGKHNLFVESIK
ncbi:M28 family peptidase [Acidobacteriota bacterium]